MVGNQFTSFVCGDTVLVTDSRAYTVCKYQRNKRGEYYRVLGYNEPFRLTNAFRYSQYVRYIEVNLYLTYKVDQI